MAKKNPTRKPPETPAKSVGVLVRFSPAGIGEIDAHLATTHEPRESFCRRAIMHALPKYKKKGGMP